MSEKFLTTTQAADFLSVSPDTVLKWVKAGKIEARRTLGGHYRIPDEIVRQMMGNESSDENRTITKIKRPAFQYCWEHKSNNGGSSEECRNCVVYRSGARRCYELREIPEQFGGLGLHCQETCEVCEYFKLVNNIGINILVISNNDRTLAALHDNDILHNFAVKTAATEYQSATLIESFRPDFIVVDCSLGSKKSRQICRHISEDSRIPLTRIILTSRKTCSDDFCDQEIFGWIRKPFTLKKLQRYLSGIKKRAL